MTENNLKILTNIIGAVESGGQVYGKRDYSSYAPAYANSSNEHTCTLGWCQFYGANAKKLVQKIYNKDKNNFKKLDTANIEKKLSEDWVATKWNPSSAEKKALINIISSDIGKQCQDEMFQESVKDTIIKANREGCSTPGARMMFVEIAHLGGDSAAKRIWSKMNPPYNVDKIFSTLLLDQSDKSNDNQVGDKKFQSRHECCVKWIKQYVKNYDGKSSQPTNISSSITTTTVTSNTSNVKTEQQLVIEKALSYVGTKESPANSNNVIFNTHYYGGAVNDPNLAWCCAYVWDIFRMVGLSHLFYDGQKTAYCPTVLSWAQNKGLVVNKTNAQYGDIVLFDWNYDGVADHIGFIIEYKNGIFYTVEGNTSTGNDSNGGQVMRRERNASSIIAIVRPKYGTKNTSTTTSSSNSKTSSTTSNTTSTRTSTTSKGSHTVIADSLNVRTWAGTSYPTCSFSPLTEGAKVNVEYTIDAADGTGGKWSLIEYNGLKGFVLAEWIE